MKPRRLRTSSWNPVTARRTCILDALEASQEQDFPDGLGYKHYSDTFVAMGYWDDEDQDEWVRDPEAWRTPCGHKVQVRRTRKADGYGGKFNTLVKQGEDGEEIEESEQTYCDPPG